MTILKCSATTCMYNQKELCSKGEIEVNGSNARYADETCCASFQERTGGAAKNSFTEAAAVKRSRSTAKPGNVPTTTIVNVPHLLSGS